MSGGAPIRCYSCGSLISCYYQACCVLKKEEIEKQIKEQHIHVDPNNRDIDPDIKLDLHEIFEKLNIPIFRYCCRQTLTGYIPFYKAGRMKPTAY
jgi:DNA-directed RNA polymerase subunit N (RpoN/RPB10)